MDPLTIGSAVIGLIAGASRIVPILYNFITLTRDAPKTASQVLDEMQSIIAALTQLQTYLTGATTSNGARRSMLTLRNISATLTACVTTYSDLEDVVSRCVLDGGKVSRPKWVMYEGQIDVLVQRMQAHKLSLTLMLTILQCESTQVAEISMTRLHAMVEDLMASNADMRTRMDQVLTDHPAHRTVVEEDIDPLSQSAFETDLDTSRVYRKLRARTSLWSVNTSQQGSMALTAFSALTMDDVSNLSVVRLPVWSKDIVNAFDYEFEEDDFTPQASPVLGLVVVMDEIPEFTKIARSVDDLTPKAKPTLNPVIMPVYNARDVIDPWNHGRRGAISEELIRK
ncbi:hypothetical protein HBI44_173310 [Parastagonospora nodorum]|nr:hypothetical protein HBI44_173310 [Parastagonospora nodorum]